MNLDALVQADQFASTCSLSVAKWVHLNWGDDGLINMFVKIWRLLRPVCL